MNINPEAFPDGKRMKERFIAFPICPRLQSFLEFLNSTGFNLLQFFLESG